MAIALQFICFIVPIKTIEEKYPGGWAQCKKDYEERIGKNACYDNHLFKIGAMSPMDIQTHREDWDKHGFDTLVEQENPTSWTDVCVVDSYNGLTLPCDWLEVEIDKRLAYLKGQPKGEVIGNDKFTPD